MKTAKKFLALFLAAAMILALCCACGKTGDTPEAGNPTVEKTDTTSNAAEAEIAEVMAERLTVAVEDDSFTVAPFGSEGGLRDWTVRLVWGTLAYRPFIGAMLDKGELDLIMAKEITKIDGTTYKVVLHEGITDSKGNSIKASDVAFSFDTLRELGFESNINTYYDSCKVLGDYELELKLTADTEGAIENVLNDGTICSQKWYEGASDDEIQNNPATTGPYTVSNLETAASVTFTARDYWKTDDALKSIVEYQNVENITVKCIAEASMRAVSLENKEIDLAEVGTNDVGLFTNNDGFTVASYDQTMNQYLLFNTSENSPCNDVRVRQAIAYAFDTWTMFLGYGHDQGVVNKDVCPSGTPDYQAEWLDASYYDRNLDKAKELLKEAGYGDDELHINIMTVAQAPQGTAVALQAMLQEAGIDAEIVPYDRALYFEYIYDDTKWDICNPGTHVTDFATSFWNEIFNDSNYERGTQGFTVDAKLQELLDKASADRSPENMKAFHDYYTEQCYALGLFHEIKSVVAQSGVEQITLSMATPILNAMQFADDYQPAK